MHNTLIPIILSLLKAQTGGLSEYEIMQILTENEHFSDFTEESQLVLFQKHFMIMNALYELQHQLWRDEQVYLEVSPLNIEIKVTDKYNSEQQQLVISENEKLSLYYRDWQNFESTDEQAVDDLLARFWQKYISADKKIAALQVLELSIEAAQHEITENYRRLAAKHHPDKGGDKEHFIKIRQAYEILKI